MKLKSFVPKDTLYRREGKSFLGINVKNGLIHFSLAATSLLDLKEGDEVEFMQDEENKEDWYITKDTAEGYKVRLASDKKGFNMNSMPIVRAIVDSVEYTGKTGRIILSKADIEHKGRTLYPIIARSLKTTG